MSSSNPPLTESLQPEETPSAPAPTPRRDRTGSRIRHGVKKGKGKAQARKNNAKKNKGKAGNGDAAATESKSVNIVPQRGVYAAQLGLFPELGYSFRFILEKDDDRMWGAFEFGSLNGMVLIKPGPIRSKQNMSLSWRGVDPSEPGSTFISPLRSFGEIRFKPNEISGYLKTKQNGKFHFHGKRQDRDPPVPRSVQSFVDEWNSLGDGLVGPSSKSPLIQRQDFSGEQIPLLAVPVQILDDWDGRSPCTGEYVISCSAITDIFGTASSGCMLLNLTADNERMWGEFEWGPWNGLMRMETLPSGFSRTLAIKFSWACSESGNSRTRKGNKCTGELYFLDPEEMEGSIYNLYGKKVDFRGRRVELTPQPLEGGPVPFPGDIAYVPMFVQSSGDLRRLWEDFERVEAE